MQRRRQLKLVDEINNDSLTGISANIQFLDKEIRKLWDLSNKRNKVNIAALQKNQDSLMVDLSIKRGLELIKPGVKCSDICHELNELFAELGYLQYRTFGYGHSFGVLSHFYGREAGLELREDIDTVLEENMVVSMERSEIVCLTSNGHVECMLKHRLSG